MSAIDTKIDTIEASVGLSADGAFIANAANYGGDATTIGGEIKNVDAAVKELADVVATMATDETVSKLTEHVTAAEGEIDALQAATAGFDANNTVAAAIASAKAEAKTEVVSGDATHVTVTPDTTATDHHVKYTITVNNVVDSTTYTQDQNAVSERIAAVEGDVDTLQGQVAALSSATHFEGKFESLELALVAIDRKGDIVIVGNKEYIYNADVTSDSKSVDNFVELGDTTAAMEGITSVSDRVETLESWKTEMTKADGTLATMNTAIDSKLAAETFNTFKTDYGVFKSATNETLSSIDAQFDKVDGITGFDSDTVNAASYSGTTYLDGATTLKAADVALDVALKNVAARVAVVEGEVAEVVGDNTTISVATDNNGKATVSAVTSDLAENATGLAKAKDVFDALCWVEFN